MGLPFNGKSQLMDQVGALLPLYYVNKHNFTDRRELWKVFDFPLHNTAVFQDILRRQSEENYTDVLCERLEIVNQVIVDDTLLKLIDLSTKVYAQVWYIRIWTMLWGNDGINAQTRWTGREKWCPTYIHLSHMAVRRVHLRNEYETDVGDGRICLHKPALPSTDAPGN